MNLSIPLGIEDFAEMRENGYYYVDKTSFIKELLNQKSKANLVTRPRRFGKTLTMSMLEDFFDISRNSIVHFKDLLIYKDTVLCREWMNKWPVIFISLKGAEGLNFEDAYGMLVVLISNLCKKYAFLENSEKVDADDRYAFMKIKARRADKKEINDSLALLTRMMTAHYGKQTILLVDEYDVPLAKAHANGYYREMLEIIRAMLGASLKTNPYLKIGVITGCLKISKESIFTGINNLAANTITTEHFGEGIGFTEPEVFNLLSDAGFSDHAEEIRRWYDGYRFGNVNVYCPWDVLNHVAALMTNPKACPRSYWEDTSSNDVLYRLLENKQFDVSGKFETLLAGEVIHEVITENLTYDSLDASEENIWSLLLMTGYLTPAQESSSEDSFYQNEDRRVALRIPNEEVKAIFKKSVKDWFDNVVRTTDRSVIFNSLWSGDARTAEEEISNLLFMTISYNDYKESFYHAFIAGLFAGAGYIVESNHEYGEGRPDVVINEKRKRRAMLFEIKCAGDDETLEHACSKAVAQIHDRKYDEPFKLEGYCNVVGYGIAFKKKNCMIKKYNDSDDNLPLKDMNVSN